MKTVSVIIPAYNAGATLAETIATVTKQDYPDWELIIVDDGSTDDTLLIASEEARHDERIRVVSSPNGGPSRARNVGLTHAQGEMIAFLDADDRWSHDKLSTHVGFLRARPEVDLSFASVCFFNDDPTRGRHRSRFPKGRLTLAQVLGENPACTSSNIFVRRSFITRLGAFNESLRHAEDHELLLRAVLSGAHVEGIHCELVAYRTSPIGASADLLAMLEGWRQIMQSQAIARDELSRALAVYYRYLARHALRTNQPPEVALRYIKQALESSASGFFGDLRRGVLTIVAAGLSLALPLPIRRRLLADN
ncbi:MAG: glycosyltransferase [Pseudomonadota bacterium]